LANTALPGILIFLLESLFGCILGSGDDDKKYRTLKSWEENQ
jgi:hypothetical protein